MSTENKDIFQEHIEQIWNNGDASGIERFIAPNYVGFDAAELISGIEGYKQHFERLTTAFSDIRITIEALLAEEDRVVARFVVEATHTGNLGDIPPTGKRVTITGIEIARINSHQIIEEHANSDTLGLLKQIGITPESVKVAPLVF
ncbi:MAG TPA: ester cyclase [Roseiflexaceae bacterium]|nr:ester cyclase [Roseiflexaceae bacterium]